MELPPQPEIEQLVVRALAEDIGSGDITAELIPPEQHAVAVIIAREAGVLCGAAWAQEVFRQLSETITLQWAFADGAVIAPGDKLVRISGNARSILSGERSALNFLQTLSGTATTASRYAHLVAHTSVVLLDTRKTLPGLRRAQKYAVTVGGCQNHRLGLYDAFLIKENHIAACGGIEAAVAKARAGQPSLPVEIEVQDLAQLQQAIAANADSVLLDNFDESGLREAVALAAGRVKLEASGGVDERTLVAVAETGVDFISIGALTKNCRALDLSLLLEPALTRDKP